MRKESHKNRFHFDLQSIEFVAKGILAFVVFLLLTIVSYRIFIVEKVKKSDEFFAASHFVQHSKKLNQALLTEIEGIEFEDINVSEKKSYGICELYFELKLEHGIVEKLKIGLVKISDFWVVYQTVLNPFSVREEELDNTFSKIVKFYENVDFGDYQKANVLLTGFVHEIVNPSLKDFLYAKLYSEIGERARAIQLLENIEKQLSFSRYAILYTKAWNHYQEKDFKKSEALLLSIEDYYKENVKKKKNLASFKGLFDDLPKNPFLASFEPDNVLASSRKLLSLVYHDQGIYEKGLHWAEKAVAQAKKIKSSVIRSSAQYLKALNYYGLKKYNFANLEFLYVILDLENPNLSQKAWSYYFRGVIAMIQQNYDESLDHFETAVNLEPSNTIIRKGTIKYLRDRAFVGDLEIALGMALRGVDFGYEREEFKGIASELYQELGLFDKTQLME